MSGQRCTSAEGRNPCTTPTTPRLDRKSTRLNSSHLVISYAVFCLKKKQRAVSHLGHVDSPNHADISAVPMTSPSPTPYHTADLPFALLLRRDIVPLYVVRSHVDTT